MAENTHVPDPTDRTIETLHREIEQLETKLTTEMLHKDEISDIRHVALDKQLDLMEAHRIERAQSAENHRLELKSDAEARRLEQKEDDKKALDAALAAQKEAVKEQTVATNLANAKSETAMNKALEQTVNTFTAAIAGITGTVNDLKERVGGIDQFRKGGTENHNEKRSDLAVLVQIAAMAGATFIGLMGIALGIYLHH